MLWLSIALPSLALDLIRRGALDSRPLAVLKGSGRGPQIWQCNSQAGERGIRPGMSLHAALALAPELRYRKHNPEPARLALERLAAWAGRFSPLVSLDPPAGILLELEGSLTLFGGLEKLCRAVEEGVADLGYQAVLAVAPFPLAAGLLARSGRSARVCAGFDLAEYLVDLPVAAFEQDGTTRANLEEIGVRRLGQLFALPRDGLARRFGPDLVDRLDRLLGRRPDPRPAFVPPSTFRARLDLPCPSRESEALLFAVNRLLQELGGRLIAATQGVEGFSLILHHGVGKPARLYQGLAQPGCDAEHWLKLLRVRFDGMTLDRPVEAVEIRAERLVPLAGRTDDLFGRSAEKEGARLLDELRARLGSGAVQGLSLTPDHRPERAWRPVPVGSQGRGLACPPRPLWLLREPLELTGVPLPGWRLEGPERIETGWWDGADVSRDYYVAAGPNGERWWLFQERRNPYRWFVHGLFA